MCLTRARAPNRRRRAGRDTEEPDQECLRPVREPHAGHGSVAAAPMPPCVEAIRRRCPSRHRPQITKEFHGSSTVTVVPSLSPSGSWLEVAS